MVECVTCSWVGSDPLTPATLTLMMGSRTHIHTHTTEQRRMVTRTPRWITRASFMSEIYQTIRNAIGMNGREWNGMHGFCMRVG